MIFRVHLWLLRDRTHSHAPICRRWLILWSLESLRARATNILITLYAGRESAFVHPSVCSSVRLEAIFINCALGSSKSNWWVHLWLMATACVRKGAARNDVTLSSTHSLALFATQRPWPPSTVMNWPLIRARRARKFAFRHQHQPHFSCLLAATTNKNIGAHS
jgi:hypothetical protein